MTILPYFSVASLRPDAQASDVTEPPVPGVTYGNPQYRHNDTDAGRLASHRLEQYL